MRKTSGPDGLQRRDRVLALLEQSGTWRSGEDISQALGISRAAVAKHVAALRQAGHAIAAAPRRGYLLQSRLDELTPESVTRLLPEPLQSRLAWRFLPETSSTNNEAALWAMEGAPEWAAVMAANQTRGKGRKGHDWFTAARGLQFSVVLRPGISANDFTFLTPMATVAVAEAVVRETGLQARVKYPNDVLLEGRKIAGILVETGLRGGEADWAVLGIGCNVNAVVEDFPLDLRHKTTSLLIEGGLPVGRSALTAAILERLEHHYGRLLDGDRNLDEAWQALGGETLPTPKG